MTYFKIIGLFLSLNVISNISAQIKSSKIIQRSPITTSDSNTLYFLDFWATWCGPCIHAKKHLTVIQKQFPEDLHVISLTQESPAVIDQFLNKNESQLTIAIDYKGVTFKKYHIKSLPQGILFDAGGKVLWQGHPGDLTAKLIDQYLSEVKRSSSLEDFVLVVREKRENIPLYMPKAPIEISKLNTRISEFIVEDTNHYTMFEGQLLDILMYLSRIGKAQIVLDENLNRPYRIYIKKPHVINIEIAKQVIEELDYTIKTTKKYDTAFSLTLESPNFWDRNQIDWGENAKHYLVGDSDISADNTSLKDLTFELSNVLEMPVIILNPDERSLEIHDWQIHYKYFEFMKNNFLDYGIAIKKEKLQFPLYTIIKKTP